MDLKNVSELGGVLTLLEKLITRYVDGWLGELSCPQFANHRGVCVGQASLAFCA